MPPSRPLSCWGTGSFSVEEDRCGNEISHWHTASHVGDVKDRCSLHLLAQGDELGHLFRLGEPLLRGILMEVSTSSRKTLACS